MGNRQQSNLQTQVFCPAQIYQTILLSILSEKLIREYWVISFGRIYVIFRVIV